MASGAYMWASKLQVICLSLYKQTHWHTHSLFYKLALWEFCIRSIWSSSAVSTSPCPANVLDSVSLKLLNITAGSGMLWWRPVSEDVDIRVFSCDQTWSKRSQGLNSSHPGWLSSSPGVVWLIWLNSWEVPWQHLPPTPPQYAAFNSNPVYFSQIKFLFPAIRPKKIKMFWRS